MACRGVLFAIDDATAAALLAAVSDGEVIAVVRALEQRWDEAFLAETDKCWDTIHRALSDGSLNPGGGTFPLNRAILGGRQLHQGDSYVVSFVNKDEVALVAHALAAIDDGAMRERYDTLVPAEIAADYGADDREASVGYFHAVAELYDIAAKAGRAVVFAVDQ